MFRSELETNLIKIKYLIFLLESVAYAGGRGKFPLPPKGKKKRKKGEKEGKGGKRKKKEGKKERKKEKRKRKKKKGREKENKIAENR